jgi:hypothetical protein
LNHAAHTRSGDIAMMRSRLAWWKRGTVAGQWPATLETPGSSAKRVTPHTRSTGTSAASISSVASVVEQMRRGGPAGRDAGGAESHALAAASRTSPSGA